MRPERAVAGLVIRPHAGGLGCAPERLGWRADTIGSLAPIPLEAAAGRWIMPPLSNAHDHARGIRPGALGAFDLTLEMWLALMSVVPVADPWLVVANALGRQALSGCGAIMIHYTAPQDPARVAEELREVALAAQMIGVRVAIAVALRDGNTPGHAPEEAMLASLPGAVAQAIRARLLHAPASPADQVKLVDDLAAELDDPLVDVQYGPVGLACCSEALLRLVAERSALTGRRVHMHLPESLAQRARLDAALPQGPLRFLDSIGLLSPRLSVAHAAPLRPDEMALLAERGVAVSINSSADLTLRNGIAPAAEMHRRGMRLVTGLDGFSLDDDDDALRELRLNGMLHRGVWPEEGWSLPALFAAATVDGREVLGGGRDAEPLALGAAADLLVLERSAADALIAAEEPALLAQRATRGLVREMIVRGNAMVRDGRLLGIDLAEAQAELGTQLRANAGDTRAWRDMARCLPTAPRRGET